MKREQVYVLVDTPEKCRRAYEILSRHKQPVYGITEWRLKEGIPDSTSNPYINFVDEDEFKEWIGCNKHNVSDKTEISLDELEEMLGVGKATMREEFKFPELTYKDSEEIFTTEKRINNCIEKILIDYPEKDKIHIDLLELINGETSELRKQLEEANTVIAEQSKQILKLQNLIDNPQQP